VYTASREGNQRRLRPLSSICQCNLKHSKSELAIVSPGDNMFARP
jgi:hypothetical protein